MKTDTHNDMRDTIVEFLNDALGDGDLTLPVQGRVEGANGAGFNVAAWIDDATGQMAFGEGPESGSETILRYPITVWFVDTRNKGATLTMHTEDMLPGGESLQ